MSTDLLPARAQLADWTRRFAAFPSPQTALFEAEPQVQAFLAGPVVAALDACGLPHRRDGMGNVIVELGGGPGPSLMLMAYAMTHPANRMERPFAAEMADGTVRGRGLAEQKGALVAALAAVAAAAAGPPLRGRMTLAVSAAGETGRHDAARAILAATAGAVPDAAVIAIGTSGRLALANKGRIDVNVTVRGRASHSSTPWAGVDAIAGARAVLDRVLALDVGGRVHPGLGRATLVATAIRSFPEATHTVQDEVRITFDRRLLPGDDADAAFAAIAAAVDIGPPWRVAVERGPHMFPAEIDADGPLARAVREGCAAAGVAVPATFHSSGALDAGLFHHLGGEAAMWGPGDMDLWHSDEERIALDAVEAGARGYLGLIRSFLR